MKLAQYIFDCSQVNSLPNVGFIIGGNAFELTGSEYVIKVSSTIQHLVHHNSNIYN